MSSKCLSRVPDRERVSEDSAEFGREEIPLESAGSSAAMEVKRGDRGHIVTLHGDMDLDTAEVLETELSSVCEHCRNLTLDLRRVKFLDSAGLQVILNAYRKLAERDAGFSVLEGDEGNVAHVLRRAGLESLIHRHHPGRDA
jgi:anti-sigma B factor antagonist